MEEPDRNFSAQASSSSSSNRVYSGAATASSSSSFPVAEEEEDHDDDQHSQFVQPQAAVSYQVDYGTAEDEAISRFIRDDSWSCIVVVLTFWFFGSSVSFSFLFSFSTASRFIRYVFLIPRVSFVVKACPYSLGSLRVQILPAL